MCNTYMEICMLKPSLSDTVTTDCRTAAAAEGGPAYQSGAVSHLHRIQMQPGRLAQHYCNSAPSININTDTLISCHTRRSWPQTPSQLRRRASPAAGQSHVRALTCTTTQSSGTANLATSGCADMKSRTSSRRTSSSATPASNTDTRASGDSLSPLSTARLR